MNRIAIQINAIDYSNDFHLVKGSRGGFSLSIATLELPPFASVGASCDAVFKESETFLFRKENVPVCYKNQIPCIVFEVTTGEFFCLVQLSSPLGTIKALLLRGEFDTLSPKLGDALTAIVGAMNIGLGEQGDD